ncbi:hypothetical protein CB1_001533063 [Camelus ferus]|nr:hypothetical protein CB1_001533063 [Camelus ferus]
MDPPLAVNVWCYVDVFRCLPNYCEHGGSCSQSWATFYCNCSDTGYAGATCHNSVYEQSCEAYRHQGNTAGFFYIDSDGSGPLAPFRVYCNVTEDKIWTSVQHNSTELTHVRGADTQKPYSMALDYGGSLEQLEAVIDGSEHCEQEVSYHCRRSRLLNTPSKALPCLGPCLYIMRQPSDHLAKDEIVLPGFKPFPAPL